MRGGTVQINWHDTKPVLACDFHPISGLLATGGADYDIKLWATVSGVDEKKAPGVTYHSNLSYHSSAVNSLRFSPSGEQLASGADGGELIIWKSHTIDAGEVWKVLKSLVFHRKDILDLQWSTDGAYLISGSVDNSCIIWDANKGTVHQILDAHLHYVQGVAWDPLGKYATSLSSDRTCRIYINKPSKIKGVEKMNHVCQHVISKAEPQMTDESKSARMHLFHDERLPSFFRRLAWSPDGSFLLVPAGSHRSSPSSEPVNTAYIFSRKDLSRPALMLPVATLNSLYIYDTESIQPIVIVAGLHYAAITDIAWSPAGNYLALSSQDGYCTLLEFENQELGLPISLPEGKQVNGDVLMLVEEKQVTGDANTSPAPEAFNENSKNASVESGKETVDNSQKEKDENKNPEQLASPSTREQPPSKAAKRRITPMAID